MPTADRRSIAWPAACGASRSTRSCRDTRTRAAVGMRVNFSDPLQLNRLSVARRYSPGGDLPSAERVHVHAELRALRLARRAPRCNAPTSTTCSDRPRSAARATTSLRRPHEHADLRRAAAPRSRHRAARSPATSTGCRSTRTCRSTSIGCYDASRRRWPTATCATRSATWTTRTGAQLVGGRPEATSSTARLVPQLFAARYDRGVAAAARPFVGVARGRRPASRRAIAHEPFANFFFGGFGNNYVDHGDEKRYREYYSLPGRRPQRDRRPQLREGRCSSGTCRRGDSAALGTPRFLCDLAAARGLRRRRWPRISTLSSCAATLANAGGQVDFRFSAAVGARHDAVGRRRRRVRGRLRGRAAKPWCR